MIKDFFFHEYTVRLAIIAAMCLYALALMLLPTPIVLFGMIALVLLLALFGLFIIEPMRSRP